MPFYDVLSANSDYAADFEGPHGDGTAHAGILMLTCMDSRIEPLTMIGLKIGDAKILRTPGAHLSADALNGCILGVHKLNVDRIMIVVHTRCAMENSEATLHELVRSSSGLDDSEIVYGGDPDRFARVAADVTALRTHHLVGQFAEVAGFDYDVDTGQLRIVC